MGFSTPKEPFNLADFLSKKATHSGNRKIRFGRTSPVADRKPPVVDPAPKDEPETK